MARTLKELAKEALAVQDACNLSGVAQGFARCMSDLCALVPDTGERNEHPIAILWADKIAHLTGTQYLGNDRIFAAYKAIRRILDSGCKRCGALCGDGPFCLACHTHEVGPGLPPKIFMADKGAES